MPLIVDGVTITRVVADGIDIGDFYLRQGVSNELIWTSMSDKTLLHAGVQQVAAATTNQTVDIGNNTFTYDMIGSGTQVQFLRSVVNGVPVNSWYYSAIAGNTSVIEVYDKNTNQLLDTLTAAGGAATYSTTQPRDSMAPRYGNTVSSIPCSYRTTNPNKTQSFGQVDYRSGYPGCAGWTPSTSARWGAIGTRRTGTYTAAAGTELRLVLKAGNTPVRSPEQRTFNSSWQVYQRAGGATPGAINISWRQQE